jgi:hypothetical protein
MLKEKQVMVLHHHHRLLNRKKASETRVLWANMPQAIKNAPQQH